MKQQKLAAAIFVAALAVGCVLLWRGYSLTAWMLMFAAWLAAVFMIEKGRPRW